MVTTDLFSLLVPPGVILPYTSWSSCTVSLYICNRNENPKILVTVQTVRRCLYISYFQKTTDLVRTDECHLPVVTVLTSTYVLTCVFLCCFFRVWELSYCFGVSEGSTSSKSHIVMQSSFCLRILSSTVSRFVIFVLYFLYHVSFVDKTDLYHSIVL